MNFTIVNDDLNINFIDSTEIIKIKNYKNINTWFLNKDKYSDLFQLSFNSGCTLYLTENELRSFPIEYFYILYECIHKNDLTKTITDKLTDINSYTDDYIVEYNKVNDSIEEINTEKNKYNCYHAIIFYKNNRKFYQILHNTLYYINSSEKNYNNKCICICIYNEQDFYSELIIDKKQIISEFDTKVIFSNFSNKILDYFVNEIKD